MNPGALPAPLFAVGVFLEYVLLIGALLLVAGGVAFWAAVIRKPKGERRYKYHRSPRGQTPPPAPASKRKRRSEPPRNPTLAETRGLPPVRESQSAADQRYQY